MKILPDGVSAYARTDTFSARSIPDNLRKSHRTKTGTWARIVILEGRLRYRVLEPVSESSSCGPTAPALWSRMCRTRSKPWATCGFTSSSTAEGGGWDRREKP